MLRAAEVIRRVTAAGWEIIDRWKASTSTMWAWRSAGAAFAE
jgi:hypothetical protein